MANFRLKGARFRDKSTGVTYRVKAVSNWIVLLERENGSARILTSLNILKCFYERMTDQQPMKADVFEPPEAAKYFDVSCETAHARVAEKDDQ